ncbi:MAG: PAS domain S-box protein [Desulfobulbaceae bacterium]|nr:PAS domain S-box protein [Desulfobulbaceae bacterium]
MNTLNLPIDLFYRRHVALRILLLLMAITILGSSHSTFASNQESSSTSTMPLISAPKNVLVLFSYHRAGWSDNVQKGIESVFTPYKNVNFFYEYMDTKRLKTKEYLETLLKIYIEKYAEAHIDVVISVDNNALDLLAENARTLLPDTPVVFCGINDYRPALHATRYEVTGVVEYGDFSDNLKIAFRARPHATKLYIINDHTETGETNTRDLLAVLSSVAPGIQAVLTDRMSHEELSTTLQEAAPQQVAFFVSFWKDGTGRNIEPLQLDAVFRKSAIPVFGRSEWMINHGMVGGKCVTGFAQGEAGARIALQILGGTPVSALPVNTNSPNQYLFDHRMMQRYLIDEDIFPDESIGFNRPEPFYHVSKPVGVTVLIFSALLLAALGFLAVNIHRRRNALFALRKATTSLEQSESRYRGMIENIHDTFYRTDAQGFLIFISPSGAQLLGYESPQEMIGRPIASHWNFPTERLDMLELMERDGVVRDYEVVLTRKDGSLVPVSTTSSYYHDEDGQILGVEGIFRDITERKQSEEALQESEEKYRTVADFTYNMETWRTPDDMYRYVSPSCERITGQTVAEFLVDPNLLIKITHPDDQSEVIEHFLEAKHGDGTQNMGCDFRILTAEGDIRWLGHSSTVVHGRDGQPLGRRESYRDITKRKLAEDEKEKLEVKNRQLQKVKSLGRMAGAIAHHFNNKLFVVMANLEFALSRQPQDNTIINALTAALKAADKAAEVSRLMLTYLGQATGTREPLNLSEICRRRMPQIQATIPKNVVLETSLLSPGPTIIANSNQIQLILTNLISNSREAVGDDQGAVQLTVKTVSLADIPILYRFPINWQPEDTSYACLEIRDTGCGIATEDIEEVFDPFFSKKFTGRGLGLAVVLGLVQAHSGVVTVESAPGQGSVFRVFFPMAAVEVPFQPDKAVKTQEIKGFGTVLLVDDDEIVLDITRMMLTALGFEVLSASGGIEAVEIFQQHKDVIRFVLTDFAMPHLNGLETLTALRQIAPGIPVILASGYSEEQVIDGTHSERPQAFLAKPYAFQALKDAIYHTLADNT